MPIIVQGGSSSGSRLADQFTVDKAKTISLVTSGAGYTVSAGKTFYVVATTLFGSSTGTVVNFTPPGGVLTRLLNMSVSNTMLLGCRTVPVEVNIPAGSSWAIPPEAAPAGGSTSLDLNNLPAGSHSVASDYLWAFPTGTVIALVGGTNPVGQATFMGFEI